MLMFETPSTTIDPATSTTSLESLLEHLNVHLTLRRVTHPLRWAEAIAGHVLSTPHKALRAQWTRQVERRQIEQADRLLRLIDVDTPVAYVLGEAPFLDWDFHVTPDTLIPRPDTELFVEALLCECAKKLPESPIVLEVCCGCGCVACALAMKLPQARVLATDISEAALGVAHRNVIRHGLSDQVSLGLGDLLQPARQMIGPGRFDLIVSNPPYIPQQRIADMGRVVAEHEPHLALDGGDDGLDPHRRLLREAIDLLAPGAPMYLEHEHDQGQAARQLVQPFHDVYDDVHTLVDANGKDRGLAVRRR